MSEINKDLQDYRMRNPLVEQLSDRIKELEKWIDDLQSGMYINCVYCGHRYPPGIQASRRKILYEHIKQCPKHPLSVAESRIKELESDLKLNASMSAKQCDLARETEIEREHLSKELIKERMQVVTLKAAIKKHKECVTKFLNNELDGGHEDKDIDSIDEELYKVLEEK